MRNQAGFYRKNLSGEKAYRSFVPRPLSEGPFFTLTEGTAELLARANASLAVLDSIAGRIPDAGLFISLYVRKEALMSSQIEGTQATLEDVFDPSARENENLDVADVVNAVRATEFAVGRMEKLPLCNRLIRETHAVLMSGVRGEEKAPGEFRRSQNWIGGPGCGLRNARYIPPNPGDMEEAMSDLERYIHADDGQNVLIRAALIHYQFETIHPFLDGNGRVGRLLVTLFLMQEGVLSRPALYVSYFLKKNRIEYYDRLGEVRARGDYRQWVEFFLRALTESAEDASGTIDRLTALHGKSAAAVAGMGRGRKSALRLLGYLESSPIIGIKKTAEALGVAYNTAAAAVSRLVAAGILFPTSPAGRNRCFAYRDYLDILRGGTE